LAHDAKSKQAKKPRVRQEKPTTSATGRGHHQEEGASALQYQQLSRLELQNQQQREEIETLRHKVRSVSQSLNMTKKLWKERISFLNLMRIFKGEEVFPEIKFLNDDLSGSE
jgi:hypothetical protein